MTEYAIYNLPEEERPRERLLRYGAEALSTAELLAILLGSGLKGKSVLSLASEIISHFGSMENFAEATLEELRQIKGIGEAKAMQLKAAITLASRLNRHTQHAKDRIEHPSQAYALIKEELEGEKREILILIMLDVKGCLIKKEVVSVGTLSNTLIHPREVYYPAIRHKAASVLLAHNHPSGDPTPSREDYEVTRKLIEVGKLMEIPLKDHIIVGKGRYLSLRQDGVLFT